MTNGCKKNEITCRMEIVLNRMHSYESRVYRMKIVLVVLKSYKDPVESYSSRV